MYVKATDWDWDQDYSVYRVEHKLNRYLGLVYVFGAGLYKYTRVYWPIEGECIPIRVYACLFRSCMCLFLFSSPVFQK